jgi:hypothetical protein
VQRLSLIVLVATVPVGLSVQDDVRSSIPLWRVTGANAQSAGAAGGPGIDQAAAPSPDAPMRPGSVPRAVTVARTTAIPRCAVFVDAAAAGRGDGTVRSPHKTIAAAVAAAPAGAVICVADGVYAEQLKPGEKYFTLAGGFQHGTSFTVRDSARFVSKAQGRGGSFLRVDDPGPKEGQLTAIDGFEITGYTQAIVRDVYYSQRVDVTNNHKPAARQGIPGRRRRPEPGARRQSHRARRLRQERRGVVCPLRARAATNLPDSAVESG